MAANARTPADQLSHSQLYLPVVVVIGDFLEERTGLAGAFSHRAWTSVTEQAQLGLRQSGPSRGRGSKTASDGAITWGELREVLAVTERTERAGAVGHTTIDKRLAAKGWGRKRRPLTRAPLPLQLSDDGDAETEIFSETLAYVLSSFDVWGIIATGSARNVNFLRGLLRGVDIPLIVTTDSTTVPAGAHRPGELRLMPSNRAQARAMLFAARLQHEKVRAASDTLDGAGADDTVYYVSDSNPYARDYTTDLVKQLEDEARSLDVRIREQRPRTQASPADNPLVVVGYEPFALEIATVRSKSSSQNVTVFSDGCATAAVAAQVSDGAGAGTWLVSMPAVSFDELGRYAFAAITEAGRQILGGSDGIDSVELHRAPFVELLKRYLQDTDHQFSFEGPENRGMAYRVVAFSDMPA